MSQHTIKQQAKRTARESKGSTSGADRVATLLAKPIFAAPAEAAGDAGPLTEVRDNLDDGSLATMAP